MEVRSAESSPITTSVESEKKLIGEFFEWFYSMTSMYEEKSREIEKMTGLNRNHALIIKEISRSPSVTVSELAKRMHLSLVNMVRSLNRLEKLGLITRTRSITDRRVVEIRISEKADGIKMIPANFSHEMLLNCLETADEKELKIKLKLLHKLSYQLKKTILAPSDSKIAISSKGNK